MPVDLLAVEDTGHLVLAEDTCTHGPTQYQFNRFGTPV